MPKLLLIVFIVIAVILGGYLGLAFVLHNLDKGNFSVIQSEKQNTQQPTDNSQSANNAPDKTTDSSSGQGLIGNWDTGCLVPDLNSPWAERHTFIINANGTAVHKRYSGNSCVKLAEDTTDDLNWVIPSSGRINLSYNSGIGTGQTAYDIYEVSGNTLKFGHGFCNCVSSSGKYGLSEADRFTTLNNFLVYKKQ